MKRIPITDEIRQAIRASVGDDINFEKIAVFEAIAVTSRPIVKPDWSIFKDAVVTRATMEEAATLLASGTYVPLHTLHDQGYELPVGRLFQGKVGYSDGVDNLHTLFYTTDLELADDIDNGVTEEVSIGLMTKRMLCSGCNFDYALSENEENLWDRVCGNGHALGKGGYHLKLDGVNKFMELSVVSKGASTGAKILGAQKRLLADQFDSEPQGRNNLQRKVLFASPNLGEEIDMKEIEELRAALTALTEKVDAQAGKISEQAKVVEAQAATIVEQATKIETLVQLSETVTSQGEALAKLSPVAEKGEALLALVAEEGGVAVQLAQVEEKITGLKASVDAPAPVQTPDIRFRTIPEGGASLRASTEPVQKTDKALGSDLAAFKSTK